MSSSAPALAAVDQTASLPAGTGAGGGVEAQHHRRRTGRDWAVDGTCFALSLLNEAMLLTPPDDVSPVRLALELAVCLAVSTALWWRRRWPVVIAVLVCIATVYPTGSDIALMVMVFTVAIHRRVWVSLSIAAAGFVANAAYFVYHWRENDDWWSYVIISLIIVTIPFVWGSAVRVHRRSVWNRLLAAQRQRQQRIDQARHLERTRIAREMHDVLAHRLSLLSMHAGALEFRTDADPEQVASAAGVIRANAHQALEELRDVIWVLRRDMPDDDHPDAAEDDVICRSAQDAAAGGAATGNDAAQDGAAQDGARQDGTAESGTAQRLRAGFDAIPALVAGSTQAGSPVRYSCTLPEPDDLNRITPKVARTVYRVVQEGLTNARKHAPGTAVDVTIGPVGADRLAVEVINQLRERAPEHPVPGSGLGLLVLGERVQLAGGQLHGRRTPDGRFVLRAELPCQA